MDACSLAGSVDTSHRNTGDKFAVDSHVGTTKLGDGKGKSFFIFFPSTDRSDAQFISKRISDPQ